MSMLRRIATRYIDSLPFLNLVGAELSSIEPGRAVLRLAPRPELMNHIGTLHAGAIFTLGEAASGAAMSGALADHILRVRPVAAQAQIRYLRPARSELVANATTDRPAEDLNNALERDGRVRFGVAVEISDSGGKAVAAMTVAWSVSGR